MANHLIIGLGGTGGKVLREMRKRVYEEFRSNDPGHGIYLEYLYVDSSRDDLEDRTGWKVLGKSVHLGNNQKVNINGISEEVFRNINMYPGMQAFMNEQDVEAFNSGKLRELMASGIGSQRRRLGRILFANNLSDKNNASNFDAMLKSAVGRLQGLSHDQDVTFHICAGLAGGTGSGSIIDAIAQINFSFPYDPSSKRYRVLLYLYAPEADLVEPKHDSGYYQANGYAALQELNALSLGIYRPVDVTGLKDNYTGQVRRDDQKEHTFELAYLYTNTNESGKILEIGQQLPASVADFLFQSIVVSEISGDKGQMKRLVTCENDGANPEKNQAGGSVRSRRFMSFGIKRIEYPENEIREFVTYTYATQAALQLVYNFWQDGIGYGERPAEEVGVGYLSEIKDKRNRESLLLSNPYLILSKPIIETKESGRWKELDETFESRTQEDYNDIVNGVTDKKLWISELRKLCADYFDNNFRVHGVKKFYEIQRKEKGAYAKHIRTHIEKKLFDEWAGGGTESKSILEVEKYTEILLHDCQDRIGAFNKQIANLEQEFDSKNTEIKVINNEWDGITWLRDAITGASKKVLGKYRTARCAQMQIGARIEGYRYAVELMQAIIMELTSMLEGIRSFKKELISIAEEAVAEADSKCRTDEISDGENVKQYDPDKVRKLSKMYASNIDYQSGNATSIRKRMIDGLGEDGEHSFANLFKNTDRETAVDIILDISRENAENAMEETAKSDVTCKLIRVNLLEKLSQEYNTEEKLERFVAQIAQSASTYVQMDATEKSKVIGTNDGSMQSMLQVSIPKGDENTDGFRKKLIEAFQRQVRLFNPAYDVSENYKPNQIVVVSAKSGFPLRYVSNLKVMKDRYDRLLAGPDKETNRIVLHTESFPKSLPGLYEAGAADLIKEMRRPLLLAYALGIIQNQSNPTTGERFEAMNVPDVFGLDNWVRLGKDFDSTLRMLSQDFQKSEKLKELIAKELATKAVSNDQKKQIQNQLVEVFKSRIVNGICGGNNFDERVAQFKAIIVDVLNKELKQL